RGTRRVQSQRVPRQVRRRRRPAPSRTGLSLCYDDRADDGREEDERHDLERQREPGEEHVSNRRKAARRSIRRRFAPGSRYQTGIAREPGERREAETGGRAQRPMRAKARLGGLAREIEEHQEEEVEDEDGARVQDHLDRRQKFRAREQENA